MNKLSLTIFTVLLISTNAFAELPIKVGDEVYINNSGYKNKITGISEDGNYMVGSGVYNRHNIKVSVKSLNGISVGDEVYINNSGYENKITGISEDGKYMVGSGVYERHNIKTPIKSLNNPANKISIDVKDCTRNIGLTISCPEGEYKFVGHNGAEINESQIKKEPSRGWIKPEIRGTKSR